MNFFNVTWMFGLFSLFIPILLHLQKRKIKTLDWAAVRFLNSSIVNRRRGLTLEHFFLLFCRCLLLVAFVFLFARPWTNPGDSILLGAPWGVLVLGLAFIVTSVTWAGPRIHRVLTGIAGCALAILSLAIIAYRSEANSIAGNSSCDAVIVIDGSDSMGLKNQDGPLEPSTLFSAAVKETQKFLDCLPAGSSATYLVVGDDTRAKPIRLTSNIPLLREQLDSLIMPGGANDLRNTIERARVILKDGTNPRQQILVITDDQLTNWQSFHLSEGVGSNLDLNEVQSSDEQQKCGLIAKVLNLPKRTVNLAVTNIDIENRTWRVGDKARVDIEVFNGGSEPSDSTTVDLQVNETLKQSISVDPLEPGSRRLIPTEIVWDHSGSSSLGARINASDGVIQDNDFHRAIQIQNEIQVLIVDGERVDSGTRSAAHYIRLAMRSRLYQIESIPIGDLGSDYPLDCFDVICLCNVPRLANAISERVARFTQSGGGLFVLLGGDCDPNFYNAWKSESAHVMPLALTRYLNNEETNEASIGLDWTSTQNPALRPWLASGQHDLSDWKFGAYWLTPPEDQASLPNSHTRLNFLNGHTFFTEHSLGHGRVFVQTSCPSPRSNNLISRVSFPVWHHILTDYLARNDLTGVHQKPSTSWIAQIPMTFDRDSLPDLSLESNSTAVLTSPLGGDKTVPIVRDGRFWKADLGNAKFPGLYKLTGPFGKTSQTEAWQLSIKRDANESDLSSAAEEQILSTAKCLNMDLVYDEAQWLRVASGTPVKEEWWRLFAYGALALLVFESILLRWLAKQRGLPVFPTSIAYLLVIGFACWLIWWQGWSIMGRFADIQYSNSIAGIAGLIAVLSCIIAATYWDNSSGKIGNALSMIKFVRLFELGIIGFVLLEPLKEQDILNQEIGTIAVLWDRSRSMTLKDSDTTREDITRKILWGDEKGQPSLLDDVSKSHNVQIYQYAASPQLVDFDSISKIDSQLVIHGPAESKEWRDRTNLTDALQRVLADTPKELLAGVVVISDGCDRSDLSPSKVASTFADQKIPVHAIVVGNRNPVSDASVASANAPNQIYIQDQVTVSANLHFDQLQGETATVGFYREQMLLETKSIPILSATQRTTVEFSDIPEEVGMHHYQIKIDPPLIDRVLENNQRELSVWVTKDRLNLLVVEQRPRWEFRYLKNLFAGRDKNVSLQHVLLAPDRLAGVPDPYPLVASTSRAFDDCEANRLPESELEWLKFDVIVLGDIHPEELNEAAQKSIEKFVSQRGGTLVVVSGPNSMPHKFETTTLYNLLPIQKSTNKPEIANKPFRLRLTDDGISSPLLNNMSSDVVSSQSSHNSAWERLPKLYWRHAHASAKPGATVLAWAEPVTEEADETQTTDRSVNDDYNQNPALILWHRYGGGKVLQMNFDQTWRLRYWNGDELHHGFWGKVVRWGTEDRLGLGTALVRLGLDKTKYKIQESMTVKVRLVEEDSTENPNADAVRCLLIRDGETINDFPFEQRENSGGLLQARLTLPKTPGRYRIQVTGSRIDRLLATENKTDHAVFAEFYVESNPFDDESNDLMANTTALAPLANLTGGQLLDAQSTHLLSATFHKRTNQSLNQITKPVWDNWPIGSLFLILILGEWILRKRYGFI